MRTALMRSMRYFGIASVIMFGFALVAPSPAGAQVRVGVSISVGTPPPPLLVYEQPYVPGPDYIWMPGYWAWGPAGYFWVPGAWVLAPEPGLLWTPGYWDYEDGDIYLWHPGYWARSVGYYGGINYGFGYFGRGYTGGGWHGGHFRYNMAVTRVNPRIIHYVYVDRRGIGNPWNSGRASYHPGARGTISRPPASPRSMDEGRRPMSNMQREHINVSQEDRNQAAMITHGHPQQLAVDHPFSGHNRPATFEHIRPEDHVAPSGHKMSAPPGHGGRAEHPKGGKDR